MNLEIKITGSGTRDEIAEAIANIAHAICNGDYLVELDTKGECEMEDSTLYTVITTTE